MFAKAMMYSLKPILLTKHIRYVDEELMESGNANYIFHICMYCLSTATWEHNHYT
jgi:hypothetical protein